VSIEERKRALRRRANEAIAAMTDAVRGAIDESICDAIRSLPAYLRAEQVLAYWPLADEVDLRSLLFSSVDSGKSVFLPVTRDAAISFRRWQPRSGMTTSRLGVHEPASGESPADRSSIVLVPGRAFSPKRDRLGRGGGFYDRAWAMLERYAPRVGVGYCCQIFDEVPHDDRDSIVDLLVCERGVVSEAVTRAT
jgi:5-formyltetrahydrofolate cyclo-ligase